MRPSLDSLKRAILVRGLDDWVHIAEIVQLARGHGGAPGTQQVTLPADLAELDRAALPFGLAAVRELLRDGLIRLGNVTDNGFVAWQGRLDEIISRIDEVARHVQFPVLPGHLFWIENTHSGDVYAREELHGNE